VFCVAVKVETFCFFIVKVKLTVSLLCVCVHSAWKGHPEMTYIVSGETLNPTHSLSCKNDAWQSGHIGDEWMAEWVSEWMECLYGCTLSDPRISSERLKSMMDGRRLIRLSAIQQKTRSIDMEGDWVTMAVIVSKTDPLVSNKVIDSIALLTLFSGSIVAGWDIGFFGVCGICMSEILSCQQSFFRCAEVVFILLFFFTLRRKFSPGYSSYKVLVCNS